MKKNLTLRILAIFMVSLIWLQQILMKTHETTTKIEIFNTNNVHLGSARFKLTGRGINILQSYFFSPKGRINSASLNLNKDNEILFSAKWKRIHFEQITNITGIQDRQNGNYEVKIKLEFDSQRTEKLFYQSYKTSLNTISVNSFENLKFIKTETIDHKDIKSNSIFSKSLILPESVNTSISKIDFLPRNEIIQRTLSFIPVHVSPVYNVDISPQKVSCKISGLSKDIHQIKKSSIIPYIIWDKKSQYADLAFKKPKNIEIIDYTPKKVRIKKK